MNRVVFIVDGFNLYHSLKRAHPAQEKAKTRWLDLYRLCSSKLHLIGRDAVLQHIYYISAYAEHLECSKPNITKRHKNYVQCLESTGVTALMNKFKRKDVFCKICGKTFDKYEEKQTDVMIATTLFEQLHTDSCDTIVLVTGDSDLIPAVKTGKKLFPQKKIVFAFPSSMTSKELKSLVSGSFTLNPNEYLKYQFPDPVVLSDGTLLQKPVKWWFSKIFLEEQEIQWASSAENLLFAAICCTFRHLAIP